MAATRVLTLAYWNDLLTQINALAADPPTGCAPLTELPLVTAPHIWTVDDIMAARVKLMDICSENTFGIPPYGGKWLEQIVSEIEAAIENGWCGCAACNPTIEYPQDISDDESCLGWEWSTQCGLWESSCHVPLDVPELVDGVALYPALLDPEETLFDIFRYWVMETEDGSPDPHPYGCYDPPTPPLHYPLYPIITKGMGSIDNWGVAHAPTGGGYWYASLIQTKYAYATPPPPYPIPYSSLSPSLTLSARCVRSTLPTTFAANTPGAVVGTFGVTPEDYWFPLGDGEVWIGGGFKIDVDTGLVWLADDNYHYEPDDLAWVTITIRRGNLASARVDGAINLVLRAV